MTAPAIPLEFVFFGLTLLGVGIFHRRALVMAVCGAVAVMALKIWNHSFPGGEGWAGLAHHLGHEWVMMANLLCLLTGFALLSRHFEKSHVPLLLPRVLPQGWGGGFVLLALVFALSGILDNIAAALIGGGAAHQLFRGRVHVGYLAAIVTAANAGGAGSVIGDTTTTMMWLSGISPRVVLVAYLPAMVATAVAGLFAARLQHAYSPIIHGPRHHVAIDWTRVGIVALMLMSALAANLLVNILAPAAANRFPFVGVAVWIAVLLSACFRRPDWEVVPGAARGAAFLLALVWSASMMPVQSLPPPGWPSTLMLGFVSAVFDNIPLTAVAIKQGGYDWGYLAYAVGVGGSMIWFGSSAGVAIANSFPEARSTVNWIKHSWFVSFGYVAGFAALLLVLGWRGHPG